MRRQHYSVTRRMIPTVSLSTDAEWRDVINSQPTGSIATNSNNFMGDTFIHNTPAVKARHASNEVSRALGTGCLPEYV